VTARSIAAVQLIKMRYGPIRAELLNSPSLITPPIAAVVRFPCHRRTSEAAFTFASDDDENIARRDVGFEYLDDLVFETTRARSFD